MENDAIKIYSKIKIKDWALEDRPREKLMMKGVATLSDAELLAILIGSGNRDETAVELCRRILAFNGNSLNKLGKQDIYNLLNFKGIGEAKAITIIAALELGKRRKLTEIEERSVICCSNDIFLQFYTLLSDLPHEEFWILLLNSSLEIIRKVKIGQGGVNGTIADSRLIFNAAVANLAHGLILCHNHPTGKVEPSRQDDA